MLGVVIWTDAAESKAIIWCEDHGKLAFLGQCNHGDDFLKVDLAEYRTMRLAQNPRKIAQHYCADLDGVLAKAQSVKSDIEKAMPERAKARHAPPKKQSCSVIDFAETRQKYKSATLGVD
jgi:hypothetical protein